MQTDGRAGRQPTREADVEDYRTVRACLHGAILAPPFLHPLDKFNLVHRGGIVCMAQENAASWLGLNLDVFFFRINDNFH